MSTQAPAFKATDLDLEVAETIAAEVAPGGSTTVPAHMFYEIVRKLPEGAQIVLEASGDRAVLTIRAGRSRFTLQTLPESDFPDLAAGEMTHSFKLAAADLKRLIEKTQFAISTEETRYYLNGIYLHTAGSAKASTLRAVATDGHRLAQFELPLPAGAAGMPGVIVPRKTVSEVQRLIEDSEAEIAVELSQGNSAVSTARFELFRTTAVSSGGTASAAFESASSILANFFRLNPWDASLSSHISAKTVLTSITTGTFLWPAYVSSYATTTAANLSAMNINQLLAGVNFIPQREFGQELVIPAGQGIAMRQGTNPSLGSIGWLLEFTVDP